MKEPARREEVGHWNRRASKCGVRLTGMKPRRCHFELPRRPIVAEGGDLPREYTCDGAKNSPPLTWTGAPPNTAEFELLMTTVAPDGLKWNWVVHGIPRTAAAFAKNGIAGGTAGLTSDGPLLAYSPPCSQGPGPKTYTFTLYAVSKAPTLPSQPNQVTGAVLTSAMTNLILAQSAVSVTYTR